MWNPCPPTTGHCLFSSVLLYRKRGHFSPAISYVWKLEDWSFKVLWVGGSTESKFAACLPLIPLSAWSVCHEGLAWNCSVLNLFWLPSIHTACSACCQLACLTTFKPLSHLLWFSGFRTYATTECTTILHTEHMLTFSTLIMIMSPDIMLKNSIYWVWCFQLMLFETEQIARGEK